MLATSLIVEWTPSNRVDLFIAANHFEHNDMKKQHRSWKQDGGLDITSERGTGKHGNLEKSHSWM